VFRLWRILETPLHNPGSEDIERLMCGSESLERLLSASYAIKVNSSIPGRICCDRIEHREILPCFVGGTCRRSN